MHFKQTPRPRKHALGLQQDEPFRFANPIGENLAQVFGEEWVTNVLIPDMNRTRCSQNYLYRLTTLGCVTGLAETLPPKTTEDVLLPMVLAMSEDPVPNVRFNVSKTLAKVIGRIEAGIVASKVKPVLQTMCDDQDPDVKYYSHIALQQCA